MELKTPVSHQLFSLVPKDLRLGDKTVSMFKKTHIWQWETAWMLHSFHTVRRELKIWLWVPDFLLAFCHIQHHQLLLWTYPWWKFGGKNKKRKVKKIIIRAWMIWQKHILWTAFVQSKLSSSTRWYNSISASASTGPLFFLKAELAVHTKPPLQCR